MIDPSLLLSELEALGVRVTVVENDLDLNAPRGVVTPEIIARVRSEKGAILNHLLAGLELKVAENARIRAREETFHSSPGDIVSPGSLSTSEPKPPHERASDPMTRAFVAAGLGSEVPADPEAARKRLHRLLSHEAPRPPGIPSGRDLVVSLGGTAPRERLLASYEPWPDDPDALPLRWRRVGRLGLRWPSCR